MLPRVFLLVVSLVVVQSKPNIQHFEDISPQEFSPYTGAELPTIYSHVPPQLLAKASYPNPTVYSAHLPHYFTPQLITKEALDSLIFDSSPQVYSPFIAKSELPIPTRHVFPAPVLAKTAPIYATPLVHSFPGFLAAYAAPPQLKTVKAYTVVSPTYVPQVVTKTLTESFSEKPQLAIKNVQPKLSSGYLPPSGVDVEGKLEKTGYSSAPQVSKSSFSGPLGAYSY